MAVILQIASYTKGQFHASLQCYTASGSTAGVGYVQDTGNFAGITGGWVFRSYVFPTSLFPEGTRYITIRFVWDNSGTHDPVGVANIATVKIEANNKFTGWDFPDEHCRTGQTAYRPTKPALGQMFYDFTLGKPIWWSGSAWKDAASNTV